MAGKKKTVNSPRANGLTIQTSLAASPIAIGWGRNRLALNLIYYNDFEAQSYKVPTGHGKGGQKSTAYNYYATVMMAACLGPISQIRSVYRDSSVFNTGVTSAATQASLSVYTGNIGQSAWPYLSAHHPTDAIPYSGLAYLCASSYALNSDASLQNHTVEIDFVIQDSASANGDANGADIINDFLTNSYYGLQQWPSGLIGDLTLFRAYVKAQGLFISPLLDQQTQASQFLADVLSCSNSDMIFSDGQLQIIPYGDTQITANGATYIPNVTPIYDLDDDDFIVTSLGTDPLKLSISNPADAYNVIQIDFSDRNKQYNSDTVTAKDAASIAQFGKRQAQGSKSLPHICDVNVALIVANLKLQRGLHIRNQYSFTLSWGYDVLNPMDVVTLSDAGLGLNRYPVRIVSITENDDNTSAYICEDLLIGIAEAPLFVGSSSSGFITNAEIAPGSVSSPVLFNPPSGLVSDLEVWCAVGSTNPNWGGAQVWISLDGTTYNYVSDITAAARYGLTTTDFPMGSDPDTLHSLTVDLSLSDGQLVTATEAASDAGSTLCWLGGELIAYSMATLTSASHYSLSGYIRRGQNGTSVIDHPTGTQFVRLDSAIFKYPYLSQQIGATIYVKFASFNIYGNGLQSLAECSAYSVTLTPQQSIPAAVSGLALQAAFTTLTATLIWAASSGATSYSVKVFKSDGVTLLRRVTTYSPTFSYGQGDAISDGDLERSYVITVVAVNTAGDSAPTSLTLTHAAPAVVSGVSVTGTSGSKTITWSANSEPDLAGYIVAYSSTSGFDPSTGGGTVLYTGALLSASASSLTAGATYYLRIAAYDSWSNNPAQLNFSPQMSFVA